MRWIALITALSFALGSCATSVGSCKRSRLASLPEDAVLVTTEVTPAPSRTPAELLNAQLEALESGDIPAALAAFDPRALFSGPTVDGLGTDGDAVKRAQALFERLTAEGFSPGHAVHHLGGTDQDTVRWAVDRFASGGVPYVVTTLLTGGGPWTIAAQSWDVPEADEAMVAQAQSGALPDPALDADAFGDASQAVNDWVEMLRTTPTKLALAAPLRGDTYSIGTAGEYAQSDEAFLAILAQHAQAIAAGEIAYVPIAGRILRMTTDGAAGAVVYHVAIDVPSPAGRVQISMRVMVYFLNHAAGPRYIGAHFMGVSP